MREPASAGSLREQKWIDLSGPVHLADFGGEGRPIVLVHGLGGSVENWLSVGLALSAFGHVVALDLRGHGRTPLADGQTADVWANRVLLDSFVQELFEEPVVLIGNSMGGMISILEAAEHPGRVAALVLVDPSVPTPSETEEDPVVAAVFSTYAIEGAGEDLIRQSRETLGVEAIVRRTLELCTVDVSRVDDEVVRAHVALAHERDEMEWTTDSFLQAARSLLELKVTRAEEYHGMIRSILCPTLIIHGSNDRLVPVAAAREMAEMRDDWSLEVFADTGHMPQLETPERFVKAVGSWMMAQGLVEGKDAR